MINNQKLIFQPILKPSIPKPQINPLFPIVYLLLFLKTNNKLSLKLRQLTHLPLLKFLLLKIPKILLKLQSRYFHVTVHWEIFNRYQEIVGFVTLLETLHPFPGLILFEDLKKWHDDSTTSLVKSFSKIIFQKLCCKI